MHNLHIHEGFDLDAIISYLPTGFFSVPEGTTSANESARAEINRVAITMALFGWTAQPETRIRQGAAVCEACFRTLGLWLFKSKDVDTAGDMITPATMNHLDPVEQHREYCPWRNSKSQSGGSTSKSTQPELSAWQVVIRVLKNDHMLRRGGTEADKDKPRDLADTDSRPGTGFTADVKDEDARSIREEERDKERWARLRRVKSLFDTKSSKKLRKSLDAADLKGKGLV
jgi:hypothetical protein